MTDNATGKASQRARLIRLALFAWAVWVVLAIMDSQLANKAQAVLDVAERDLQAHRAGADADQTWRHETMPLEADVCNTLSGGLWFGFLVPKANRIAPPESMVLELRRRGRCSRSQRTVLVFIEASGQASR
jgi:hypothetical protein